MARPATSSTPIRSRRQRRLRVAQRHARPRASQPTTTEPRPGADHAPAPPRRAPRPRDRSADPADRRRGPDDRRRRHGDDGRRLLATLPYTGYDVWTGGRLRPDDGRRRRRSALAPRRAAPEPMRRDRSVPRGRPCAVRAGARGRRPGADRADRARPRPGRPRARHLSAAATHHDDPGQARARAAGLRRHGRRRRRSTGRTTRPNFDSQVGTMVTNGVQSIRIAFNWSTAEPYENWSKVPTADRERVHQRRRASRLTSSRPTRSSATPPSTGSPSCRPCCTRPPGTPQQQERRRHAQARRSLRRVPDGADRPLRPERQLLAPEPADPQAADPLVADLERGEPQLLLAAAVRLQLRRAAARRARRDPQGRPGRQGRARAP